MLRLGVLGCAACAAVCRICGCYGCCLASLWPLVACVRVRASSLYIYICLKCTFIDSLYTCIQTFFFLRRSRVENWCKSVPFFLCPASAGKHCDDMTVTVKCLSVQVPQGRV